MRRVPLILLPVFLLLPAVAGAADIGDAPFPPSELPAVRHVMLRLINRERLRHDLPALTYNALLEKSAQAHAEDMLDRWYLSHRNPDGQNSGDRIRATGYLTPPCECAWKFWIGENVAWGQTTAREVMKDWMNSETHRENILNPDFTEIGIGIDDVFWVQNFGSVRTVASSRRMRRSSFNAERTSKSRYLVRTRLS